MGESKKDFRLAALRRFAVAITVFNIAGHFYLGFEQSWAQPLIALATAYAVELLLETVEARSQRRSPRFAGGLMPLVNFLLPAHISALAVSMLLYANQRLMPVAFAAAVAIASKYLLRAPVGEKSCHFFNPSNLGISATLLLFPWVGIAPPYMFSENLSGAGDWILPAVIVCTGTMLNARYTRRLPLIAAWLGFFVFQAVARSLLFGVSLVAGLVPITGVAFVLFTFYMVSDPGTTPRSTRGQVIYGAAVALGYGVLMSFHIVFGLFFALTAIGVARGVVLYTAAWARRREAAMAVATPSMAGRSGL